MTALRPLAVALALVACAQQPPEVTAVNGAAPDRDGVIVLPGIDGQAVDLVVEVVDPDEDPVLLWTPNAPPRFDLDPEEHVGTWLPEARATRQFVLLLEDVPEQGPVRYAQYVVELDIRAPQ